MQNHAISRVAVIGAGTMGSGIALEFARCGREVQLYDSDSTALAQGLQKMQAAGTALVEAQLLSIRAAQAAFQGVHATETHPFPA